MAIHYCRHGKAHQPDCEYATGDVSASGSKQGVSTQGEDVRSKDMPQAKKEAQGRIEMERTVRPNIKHLAEGTKDEPLSDEDRFHKKVTNDVTALSNPNASTDEAYNAGKDMDALKAA